MVGSREADGLREARAKIVTNRMVKDRYETSERRNRDKI